MTVETAEIPPKTLWHYTTFDTLTQILNSRSLLASDFRDTNDHSEVLYGMKILRACLGANNSFAKQGHDPVPHDIREHEEKILMDLATRFMFGQMICFSEATDSLSMWRGYGQVITRGGNGGVAIGFDSADLQTLCNTDQAISEQTPLNISLNTRAGFKGVQKIRYNASEFPQLSSALSEEGYSPDLHLRWTAKLADFIKHCKDGAFQEEQEWRVWGSGAFHRSDIAEKDYTIIGNRFRRRFHLSAHPDSIGNDLTHPLAIREIRTGPNTDHETIKRFCDTWFRVNGSYDGPLVTKSRIPFR